MADLEHAKPRRRRRAKFLGEQRNEVGEGMKTEIGGVKTLRAESLASSLPGVRRTETCRAERREDAVHREGDKALV